MFIEQGKRVSVLDLLKGIIVQSGNDATVALAEYVGGTGGWICRFDELICCINGLIKYFISKLYWATRWKSFF